MKAADVIGKVDKEYELFYLDTIKNSRENIFAKSGEIERKKYVASFIKSSLRTQRVFRYVELMTANNLIDEFYRYATDHEDVGFEVALGAYMDGFEKGFKE